MKPLKILSTTLVMFLCASAYAWDMPWDDDDRHDRWGHNGWNDSFGDFWDDGFGDMFGDAFGDVDFEFKFRASGDGWGRGWGDNFWNGRHHTYNDYHGYNDYRSGPYYRRPYYGYGYPRYAPPYGLSRPYAYAPPPRRSFAPPPNRRPPKAVKQDAPQPGLQKQEPAKQQQAK